MSAVPGGLALGTEAGVRSSDRTPSPARQLLSSFRSSPGAIASLVILAAIVLLAILAPVFVAVTGVDPYQFDGDAIDSDLGGLPFGPFGGISAEHWFGVEPGSGRDIFIRIAFGVQVSLVIALSATIVTTTVGTVLGMVAGYFGGLADQIVSRVMDFLMAFPALIFMIAVLSALPAGNRPLLLVVVLSVFGWPYTARIIRSQTMSLRNGEFVEAARASGATPLRIVFREVLPNLRSTIIVLATLAVPGYIATEAGLSFLGIGVTPPTPSLGQMIQNAVGWYTVDPAYFFIPGLVLFLIVFAFTVLGDHLRKTLDAGEGV